MRTTFVFWKVLLVLTCRLRAGQSDIFVSDSAETIASAEDEDSRLIGGTLASAGEFPFSVAINTPGRFCGGSLISRSVVMTAAQCVRSAGDAIGATVQINSIQSQNGGITRTIIGVARHPDFVRTRDGFDIMLLRLSSRVPSSIRTVRLNQNNNVPSSGSNTRVIGFGLSLDASQVGRLQRVDVPVISNTLCGNVHGSDFAGTIQLCAGPPGGGRGFCLGDAGGPLLLPGTNVQVGIVSFSNGCAAEGQPGVYTRVSSFGNWINAQQCNLLPSDDPDRPSSCPDVCFPESAQVQVQGRQGLTPMRDLQLGDRVLVDHTIAGGEKYEPVYSFGHRMPGLQAYQFLTISARGTGGGHDTEQEQQEASLTLTRKHMVFLMEPRQQQGATSSISHFLPRAVPASSVQVGDTLQMGTKMVNVTNIEEVMGQGLYAPFTPSGSIMVDGIRTSTFASLQGKENVHVFGYETPISHQWLYQALLMPFRLRCGVLLSSEEKDTTASSSSSALSFPCLHEEYPAGVSEWLYHHWMAYKWWTKQGTFVQIVVTVLFALWALFMIILNAVVQNPLSAVLALGLPMMAASSLTKTSAVAHH